MQSLQSLGDQIPRMALANAEAALKAGQFSQALEWLELLAKDMRPKEFETDLHYRLSKQAAQASNWDLAELHLRHDQAFTL